LECRRCQQVLNAAIPKVVPHCQYTESFARLVIDLRKMMTIQDVARYLGVSEKLFAASTRNTSSRILANLVCVI
jgi:hypothetical protein